jgi:hypothetical protein
MEFFIKIVNCNFKQKLNELIMRLLTAFLLLFAFSSYSLSQEIKECNLLKDKNTTLTIQKTTNILSVLIYPELSRSGDYSIKNKDGNIIDGDNYSEVDFINIDLNDLKKGKYVITFTSEDKEKESFELIIK